MRRRIALTSSFRKRGFWLGVGLWFLLIPWAGAQPLPDCYHTLAETYAFYDSLKQVHDDAQLGIMRIDTIGYSRGDAFGFGPYPILAVKLSDFVDDFESEPVSLIIAHIHAEETSGNEACMAFLDTLINSRIHYPAREPYRTLVNNTQMYFIPTMNPDGLEVISQGWDISYRKNGYKPPELNGRDCNITPGWGGDSCGVDLNRNFEFNWIFGDTLWKREDIEPFDYFRGPGPCSEPECQAVCSLALEIKPTVCIIYHQSRSGSFNESCIVPWRWTDENGLEKYCPDSAAVAIWNEGYRLSTEAYPLGGHYSADWAGARKGNVQDWMYWKIGTFAATTETSPPGANNLHPPCEETSHPHYRGLVESIQPSLMWMLRRVINYDIGGDMDNQGAPLAIYTRDASSGSPISAEWRILDTWTPLLPPRCTHEEHGRMTILPHPGQVTIEARKKGYDPDTVTTTINPGGSTRSIFLDLALRPVYGMDFRVQDDGGSPLPSRILLTGDYEEEFELPSGAIDLDEDLDSYAFAAVPEGGDQVGIWRHFWHNHDTLITVTLPAATLRMSENFESGLGNWTSGGEGNHWRLAVDTTGMGLGSVLYSNPEGFRTLYSDNADAWIQYNDPIQLSTGGNVAHLEFYARGRLDVPADSFLVEISTDETVWETVAGYSVYRVPWNRLWINLTPWTGQDIYLRFRLVTDAAIRDLGVQIDNVRVVTGMDLDAPPPPYAVPYQYRITGSYPNPFNPSTTILYETARAGGLRIAVYNVLGQEVRKFDLTQAAAGAYSLTWDGKNSFGLDVPSGLYFARLSADSRYSIHKMMLIR